MGRRQVEHNFVVVLGVVLRPEFNDVLDSIAAMRHALDRIGFGLAECIEVVRVGRDALTGHGRLGGCCCWLVGSGLGVRTPPGTRRAWWLSREHGE